MIEVSGFTPLIDSITQEHGVITAAVFGRVWRFCQMEHGQCEARIDTIATHLELSERTVIRHIKKLCDDGYLEDLTPDRRNKPHIYRDTGKAKMSVSATTESCSEADSTMTESHSKPENEPSAMTESHSRYDRESERAMTESQLKKESCKKDSKKQKHGAKKSPPPKPAFDENDKPTSHHPAIQAFRSEMHRYPRKNQYADIAAKVGTDPPDVEFWRQVVNAWKLTPYAPTNVGGMLECFERKELPTTKPITKGQQNGQHITHDPSGQGSLAQKQSRHMDGTPNRLERAFAAKRRPTGAKT